MSQQYISPIADTASVAAASHALTGPGLGGSDAQHVVVACVTTFAAWLSFQSGAQKLRLYHDYQRKLQSYDGNMALFLTTSVPHLMLLAPVAMAYRTMRRINRLVN